MIDIHCHILPRLDDGPESMKETLEMCRYALKQGVTGIIATPHLYHGLFTTNRQMILRSFVEVREALEAEKIPLQLYIGADLHLIPDLDKKIRENQALTLNHGRYYLLELPSRVLPPNLNQVIEDLVSDDYVPVITHPERNEVILRQEEILLNLLRRGALCQITAMSVTGEFGKGCEEFSLRLLEGGAVHFIASDAHSMGWRKPGLSRALDRAKELIGEERAAWLVRKHPEAVLSGGHIERVAIESLPKRKRFWFF